MLLEQEDLKTENEERAERTEELTKLQNKQYYLQNNLLSSMTEEQAIASGLEDEREQYLERQVKLQELLIKLENVKKSKKHPTID